MTTHRLWAGATMLIAATALQITTGGAWSLAYATPVSQSTITNAPVYDNRSYSIGDIYQQPGEDSEAFARRVVRDLRDGLHSTGRMS